jgi:undecaprenyl-diphosphatase
MFESFLPFDSTVFQWLQNIFHPGTNAFFDPLFIFITKLGDAGLFWIALGLIFLIPRKTRRIGIVMIGALALDVIINNGILKNLFDRPRPFNLESPGWWLQDFVYPNLIAKPDSLSFPSGHSAASFAGAVAWLLASRKAWAGNKTRYFSILGLALAVLVAFSRVYLGVHYTTDIFAGALVGTACALLSLLMFRLLEPLYEKIDAGLAKLRQKYSRKKA